MSHADFCVVYSGNIVQADLLKCVLEGEGIAARLEDEFIGTIAPYAASAGGASAVKVLVAERDMDHALAGTPRHKPVIRCYLPVSASRMFSSHYHCV